MLTDVRQATRGEDRVAQCVGDDVAIGVADEALLVVDLDRPEHERSTGPEAVRIDAEPYATHRTGTCSGVRLRKRVIVS